jgi:membrane-associated phospholipid phosphatase
MQSHYHPKQSVLWYGGATLISASRVRLHRHRISDVVGGAAVGFLTAKLELSQSRGLLLAPFIHRDGSTRTAGLELSRVF